MTKIIVTFLLWLSVASCFACYKPEQPPLPDPNTAAISDMLKAKNDVNDYMDRATQYLKCRISRKQHNRMVDDMNLVADKFNRIIRAYKKRASQTSR